MSKCNSCGKPDDYCIISSSILINKDMFYTDSICRGCFDMLMQAVRNSFTKRMQAVKINFTKRMNRSNLYAS